jgi:hypothetical protein
MYIFFEDWQMPRRCNELRPAKFNEVELDEVYRLIEADLRRREAEANGDFTQAQSG